MNPLDAAEQTEPPIAHSPDHDLAVIADSRLFDAAWYLTAYADVKASGMDPLLHFVLHGADEQRDPSEFFSTSFYLQSNPDVSASPFNPLVHYALHGLFEGRPCLPADRRLTPPFAPYPSERLMRTGLASVTLQLARDATPAERLARPDPDLYSPTVSILLPVFNTSARFLREVVQSICAQTYSRWELCIADDCSTRAETLAVLSELSADARIVVRRTANNEGIAKASDLALSIASGDYVAFVDHDDLLTPNALSEVVAILRTDPGLDYIYSDHVQADSEGLAKAWARKPSWSPEFLLSTNYIVHFKVVRRKLLLAIGGFGQERSQVQDLGISLRLFRAGARIAHLPNALYFWREHKGSVAASTLAKPGIEGMLSKVISDHLEICNLTARASWPVSLQKNRIGAFHIEFKSEARMAAVMIQHPYAHSHTNILPPSRSVGLPPGTEAYSIVASGDERDHGILLPDADVVRKFFSSLNADYVLLLSSQARLVSSESFSHLQGFLQSFPDVGAVGGKVLDEYLRVVAGGLLMLQDGDYGLIGGGEFDNHEGHWLTGQIPSNVDAVSQRCMVLRRQDLIDGPGLQLHKWGELAGTVLCQELRRRGSRIVYDPEVKVYDTERPQISDILRSALRARTRGMQDTRVYKEFVEDQCYGPEIV